MASHDDTPPPLRLSSNPAIDSATNDPPSVKRSPSAVYATSQQRRRQKQQRQQKRRQPTALSLPSSPPDTIAIRQPRPWSPLPRRCSARGGWFRPPNRSRTSFRLERTSSSAQGRGGPANAHTREGTGEGERGEGDVDQVNYIEFVVLGVSDDCKGGVRVRKAWARIVRHQNTRTLIVCLWGQAENKS